MGLNWCVRCSKTTLTLTSNITLWSILRPCDSDRYPLPKWGSRWMRSFQRLMAKSQWSRSTRWFEHERRNRSAAKPSRLETTDGWPDLLTTRFSVRMMKETLVGPVASKRSCLLLCIRSGSNQTFTGSRSPWESLCYDVYQCSFLLPIDQWTWPKVGSAGKGIERVTIPENGDWVDAYDMYGGQGLLVDFDAYKKEIVPNGTEMI